MPSSLNALLAAWAISLIVVVGTTVFFELTYDPNAPKEPVHSDSGDVASNQSADEPIATEPAQHENTPTEQNDTAITSHQAEEPKREDPPVRQDMTTGLVERQEQQPRSEPQPIARLSSGIRIEAIPELIEQSNQGPLPRVSSDGRRPFDEYAAPPPPNDSRPKIAIVITDLGMRARITRRAISDLPPRVTFAFSPYAPNLVEWGEQSRRTGHEVLLMVPMEPVNYPQNDPGPFSLLTSRSTRENINILKSSLGRMTGYVGIVNHMGSRFTAAAESLRPVLEELNRRGLMLLDSRSTQYSRAASMARDLGMPASFSNTYIDDDVNPGEIAKQLAELESRARVYDYAVGIGRPYPVTIDAVKVWAASLEDRGFVLVPITATANNQPLPR